MQTVRASRICGISTGVLVFLFSLSMHAANHYVLSGGTGAANGTDWNNAYANLPSALTRGDIYYLGPGSYAGHSFNDPASGTSVITITRASATAHGTDTGWNSTYGVGQAVFTGVIRFYTSYYTVDGAFRTTPTSGHGFKVDTSGTGCTSNCYSIVLQPGGTVTNITLRYVEIPGFGQSSTYSMDGIYAPGPATMSSIYVGYSYLHDFGYGAPVVIRGINGLTYEYNYMARNHSDAVNHSEGISDCGTNNLIVRYSTFLDIQGTGDIVSLNSGNPCTSNAWAIYGNVFAVSNGNPTGASVGNGIVAVINANTATNWLIYNNTISNNNWTNGSNQNSSSQMQFSEGSNISNVVVQNNLWFNCRVVGYAGSGVQGDYNYYASTVDNSTPSEAHPEVNNTNPLVDWINGNFNLVSNSTTGLSLTAPYNVDANGTVRGSNGVWDRGAFQIQSGGSASAPSAPQALAAIVQ